MTSHDSLPYVEAALNHLGSMAERPRCYAYAPEPEVARSDTAHEAHRVRIHNMRPQREGLITHITSAAAGRGVLPLMGLYAAAKFAVEGLTESYRYELSHWGIDSATVEPEPYQTGIFGKPDPPAEHARAADYGQAAKISHRVRTALEASTVPSQEVADAASRLIEIAAGHRPLRPLVLVPRLQARNRTIVPQNTFNGKCRRRWGSAICSLCLR